MPELPDVEIFRRYLEATSLNKVMQKVDVLNPELLEGTSSFRLKRVMNGARLKSACRHGKYLFGQMDSGKTLVLHFGMTGFLKYFKKPAEAPSHVWLLIDFADGYHLAYDCQRKLGKITLIDNVEKYVQKQGLGPDPFQPNFDEKQFKNALAEVKGTVKSALMNQHIIAGIGNIYSDKILFQAGIHPKTSAEQLDYTSLESIFYQMKEHVLPVAIEAGADPKRFPSSFIIPRRKAGGECPKCMGTIVKEKISRRTAYYCSYCHKN
jgi:formamidopyrimidine-DNA glycosylase